MVEPEAVRPSRCTTSRIVVASSATFWWITELANRVSASRCRSTCTDTSAPGSAVEHPLDGLVGEPVCWSLMPRTPTRTLRNRAGAAGWPVWPVWPGWPLPQFGVPQATMSSDSMSIEDQNCGPMPV